jgi:renalase
MDLQRVAVIGAGLAGLVAARELTKAGVSVDVFDKGRFSGGRLASRTRDADQFDYGAQYFTVKEKRFADAIEPWLEAGLVAPWPARIVDIDGLAIQEHPSEHTRYVGVPSMRSFVDALAEQLPSLQLSRRVTSIAHLTDSLLELGFEDGGSAGPYDLVILNMPPLQCEPFLSALNSPHTELVRAVEMTPCWALMLSFAEPLDVSFDAAFVSAAPAVCSWIARDSSKPGRPAGERWVVHGSGEWSQAHIEDDAAAVEAALTDAFFKCLTLSAGSGGVNTSAAAAPCTVAAPSKVTFSKAHRWRYAIASNPLGRGVLIDEPNKIAICGDWLVQNRVEGAFLSGLICSEQLLALSLVSAQ